MHARTARRSSWPCCRRPSTLCASKAEALDGTRATTSALRHKHRIARAADSHPASWTSTWRPCPCPSCLWTKRPALAQIGCADGACDHAQSALQAFPFRPESHPMVNKLTQPLQQPLPWPLGPNRSTTRLAHQSTRGPAKSPGVPLLSVFREPVQLPKKFILAPKIMKPIP